MIDYYKKYIKLHNFACKDYFVRYVYKCAA